MPLSLPDRDSKTIVAGDAVLWSRLKSGDENALSSIYTAYFEKLYNYGIRLVRDQSQVKDCIQDLFIAIWNGRERLGDVHFIKLYLFACLRRKLLRLKPEQSRRCDLDAFPLELSHKSHYLNQQIDQDVRQRLTQVVNRLTTQQREAIFLIYYEELSYKDVADQMGLKIRTVYNLIHAALLRLREHKSDIALFSFFL